MSGPLSFYSGYKFCLHSSSNQTTMKTFYVAVLVLAISCGPSKEQQISSVQRELDAALERQTKTFSRHLQAAKLSGVAYADSAFAPDIERDSIDLARLSAKYSRLLNNE